MFDPATERAIRASLEAHRGQTRKGNGGTPYAVHPVHVALILARLGAAPRVLQAALLHDATEDSPDWPLERIAREFGAGVAGVVAELTEDKSRSWEERKQAQLASVPGLSRDALLVKAADKLHNLRTLSVDLREASDQALVWERFRGGRERTLALSRALVAALAARCEPRLAAELRGALDDLERACGSGPAR